VKKSLASAFFQEKNKKKLKFDRFFKKTRKNDQNRVSALGYLTIGVYPGEI
jgi:hypothetical protein